MAASLKRVVQFGINSGFQVKSMKNNVYACASTSMVLKQSPCDNTCRRDLSLLVNPNGKPVCLVDTLALVRSLEAEGVPTKQAEAITSAITEVLYDSLDNVAATFVPKADMQKTVMLQEAQLSTFKSEVKSSQEHHFSTLQRETGKLGADIEKMRIELLANQSEGTANLTNKLDGEIHGLTNKLDREINGLKAQLEAAKYDVIKYCMGTLISISAVGLAVIRLM